MTKLIFSTAVLLSSSFAHASITCSSFHIEGPRAHDGSNDNRVVVGDFKNEHLTIGDRLIITRDLHLTVVTIEQSWAVANQALLEKAKEEGSIVVQLQGSGSNSIGLIPQSPQVRLTSVLATQPTGAVTVGLATPEFGLSMVCGVNKR